MLKSSTKALNMFLRSLKMCSPGLIVQTGLYNDQFEILEESENLANSPWTEWILYFQSLFWMFKLTATVRNDHVNTVYYLIYYNTKQVCNANLMQAARAAIVNVISFPFNRWHVDGLQGHYCHDSVELTHPACNTHTHTMMYVFDIWRGLIHSHVCRRYSLNLFR